MSDKKKKPDDPTPAICPVDPKPDAPQPKTQMGVMMLQGNRVLVAEAPDGADLGKLFSEARTAFTQQEGGMKTLVFPAGVRVQVI